jgi:hypothetical protein
MAAFRVRESGASAEYTVTGRISIESDNNIGKRTSRFLSNKNRARSLHDPALIPYYML